MKNNEQEVWDMYKIKYNGIKKFFVLLYIIIMIWNVPAFASCVVMEEQGYIEKQINVRDGSITFWTKGEPYLLDYRCLPELYITIKESKPGVLKDGDVIYFETSKHGERYFDADGCHIESEGVYAKEVKTTEKESDNHIVIRISRSNNKKQGVIKIRMTPYLYGINSNETENLPTFSLWLNADKTKENNLFSGEQNILLNECFMDILSSEEAARFVQAQNQKEIEKGFPKLTFTVGKDYMIWGNTQRKLEHPIYINQYGSAMISLEYLVYIAENLKVQVKYQVCTKKEALEAVAAKEADIALGCINNSGSLSTDYLMSTHYGIGHFYAVTKAGDYALTIGAFKDSVVGVDKGLDEDTKSRLYQAEGIRVSDYNSYEDGARAVKEGSIRAYICYENQAKLLLEDEELQVQNMTNLEPEEFVVVAAKSDVTLIRGINTLIQQFLERE